MPEWLDRTLGLLAWVVGTCAVPCLFIYLYTR